MKIRLSSILLIVGCLYSCDENPDICMERTPIPVIYNVFNKFDSINYIYITKTWSGDNGGSLVTAKNADSIYFKNVTVNLDLVPNTEATFPTNDDTIRIVPDLEFIHDKKPGIFIYPNCPVFALHYHLEDIDIVINHINIPGYDEIVLQYDLLTRPQFYTPNKDGMSITFLPDKGMEVRYSTGGLVEILLFIEIITKTEDEIFRDTIMFKKFPMASPTTFKYGNLTSALNLQIKSRPNVEFRQFGKIRMEIWSGVGSFPGLFRPEVSSTFIDFTLPGSPWVPERFVYGGTIATNYLNNLYFDEQTREAISRDTSISNFKFVKW